MTRIDDKVALITGGGTEIGQAVGKLLAEAGAKIVVTDLDANAAEKTARTIRDTGGEAVALEHDVASEVDWQRAIDVTLKTFSKLDILVNNATFVKQVECKDMSLDEWRNITSVSLDGVFLAVRSAINAMLDNRHTSSIIDISSVDGLRSSEMVGAYCASKAAARMLIKNAAYECVMKGYNIKVNSIFPGGMALPKVRLAEPIDIAKGVLFLASDDSQHVTGSDFVIDGGATIGFFGGFGCLGEESTNACTYFDA